MYFSHGISSEMILVPKYNSVDDTIIITFPSTMYGRNLPNLVEVRSMSAPMIGSVTASNRRITVTIVVANIRNRPSTPFA